MDEWVSLTESLLNDRYRQLMNEGMVIKARVRAYSENPQKYKLTGCVMAKNAESVRIMHDEHLRRIALGDPAFLKRVQQAFAAR